MSLFRFSNRPIQGQAGVAVTVPQSWQHTEPTPAWEAGGGCQSQAFSSLYCMRCSNGFLKVLKQCTDRRGRKGGRRGNGKL